MYNYSGNSAGAEAAINTYDPYFPSQHHVNSVNSSTSSPSVTSSVSNEDYTYQQTPQNGVYSPYSQGSWPGSPNSQPSPQPNNYYGPGPGPVDGGGYNGGQAPPAPHPGPPPAPTAPNGGHGQQAGQDFYNNYQCNQYDFNYYNNYQYNYNIKSEYDMKPDIIGQHGPPNAAQHHPQPPPGANPYYGGNGHVSPHNQHLMSGLPAQGPTGGGNLGNLMPMEQTQWSNPKMHQTNMNGKRAKDGHQPKITDTFKNAKKPRTSNGPKRTNNRFNGMSEEEVAKRGLPDYLKPGLDIVFIGINPSMFAAYTGKYYDGPGNHFWQALYLSGILSEPMSAVDDHKLLDLGIGFTNIVPRTTRGLSDLSRKEIADGAEVLREKLGQFKPKIAVFNGKAIYEVYSGQKKFMFGRQPEPLNDGATWLWVMPSSSARCAQLPRAVDKVPFFDALRKFRDYLSGRLPKIEDCEVVFANVSLRNWPAKNAIKTEPQNSNSENLENQVEVNPNLQPYTDGVPANVPASVTEVIEDVIKQYSEDSSSDQASSPNQ